MEPSSAYDRRLVAELVADRGEQAVAGVTGVAPVFISRKVPVP